jgi:BlaI family transcriptional regulator, penicillinase repressor
MPQSLQSRLSRRERQIMDFLFQHRSATAAEVMRGIPEPPSYSTVRALLRTLETKGHARHREDGPRYVYEPTETRERARRSAMHHLVRTFFDGSAAQAVSALLDSTDLKLDAADTKRLAQLIEKAKEEGR